MSVNQNTPGNNDKKKKVLTLGDRLKSGSGSRVNLDQDQVRQTFSHGRSKTVQVEIRKKRSGPQERTEEMKALGITSRPDSLKGLTSGEVDARLKAIKSAMRFKELQAPEQEFSEEEVESNGFSKPIIEEVILEENWGKEEVTKEILPSPSHPTSRPSQKPISSVIHNTRYMDAKKQTDAIKKQERQNQLDETKAAKDLKNTRSFSSETLETLETITIDLDPHKENHHHGYKKTITL